MFGVVASLRVVVLAALLAGWSCFAAPADNFEEAKPSGSLRGAVIETAAAKGVKDDVVRAAAAAQSSWRLDKAAATPSVSDGPGGRGASGAASVAAWRRHHRQSAAMPSARTSSAIPQGSCQDTSSCLEAVDTYLAWIPRQVGVEANLRQTYGETPVGNGGNCSQTFCFLVPSCVGELCRFDVYDNAVAAIYLSARSKLTEAREILRSFHRLMYPDNNAQNPQLLRSAYIQSGEVLDPSIDTGNNAWVGMAFAHYAAASGESCYATVARDILFAVANAAKCDDDLQGFMGRLPRGAGMYRATEHNIDMFALANMLGEVDMKNRAARFVNQMYGFDSRHPTLYATGTPGAVMCDSSRENLMTAVAADAQTWNLLAGADPIFGRKKDSMDFVTRSAQEDGLLVEDVDHVGDGHSLIGVRFTNGGEGAQWENTASAAMSIAHYSALYSDQSQAAKMASMREALLHQLNEYGAVLASVRGGNINAWQNQPYHQLFPGGSDTGLGWTYLRYRHTAATAWTGLMLLDENPFHPSRAVPAAAGGGAPANQCFK